MQTIKNEKLNYNLYPSSNKCDYIYYLFINKEN